MKVAIVFDHPRRDSFCGAVLDAFVEGLASAGHEAEIVDLYREGFDPRMKLEDEPIWGDETQVFSEEIRSQQARIDRNDALVFLFPVWWWSVPAMTKGWIDRVCNQGWAYSLGAGGLLKHRKGLMVAIAGDNEEGFTKRQYDKGMEIQLTVGVLDYIGIKDDRRTEILYGSLISDESRADILARARQLGASF